ncbi:MAG: hypothetical protein U0271_40880 [Polyangiaceae bacterium]
MRFYTALVLATLTALPLAGGCKKGQEQTSSAKSEDDSSKSKSSGSSSSSTSASTSGSAVAANSATAPPAPEGTAADAIVLDRGDGKLEVAMSPDGKLALRAYDDKGTAIAPSDITGQVRPSEGTWVTVEPSDKGVKAQLPKLEQGLTTIELALTVKGNAWADTLDVPEGGTAALQEEPKVAIAEGTKGPHGGIVDVAGDQRFELVMDEETGDVRVYFLNDKLEEMQVPPGTEITLNIEDGKDGDDEGEETDTAEGDDAAPDGADAKEEPAK